MDGDRNTKYFRPYINGRRKRLRIDKITTIEGDLINTKENTGTKADIYFEMQFSKDCLVDDFGMLNYITELITKNENASITQMPSREDIKVGVFELNGDSVGGLMD